MARSWPTEQTVVKPKEDGAVCGFLGISYLYLHGVFNPASCKGPGESTASFGKGEVLIPLKNNAYLLDFILFYLLLRPQRRSRSSREKPTWKTQPNLEHKSNATRSPNQLKGKRLPPPAPTHGGWRGLVLHHQPDTLKIQPCFCPRTSNYLFFSLRSPFLQRGTSRHGASSLGSSPPAGSAPLGWIEPASFPTPETSGHVRAGGCRCRGLGPGGDPLLMVPGTAAAALKGADRTQKDPKPGNKPTPSPNCE